MPSFFTFSPLRGFAPPTTSARMEATRNRKAQSYTTSNKFGGSPLPQIGFSPYVGIGPPNTIINHLIIPSSNPIIHKAIPIVIKQSSNLCFIFSLANALLTPIKPKPTDSRNILIISNSGIYKITPIKIK
jgi:hypothetical protein